MASTRLLLCSDLDRTLIPNGPQPESPRARPLWRRLCARPEVAVAYVSGRDLGLIQAAIDDYGLPLPDFAIADVGTSLYRREQARWVLEPGWSEEIAADWAGWSSADLADLFRDCPELELQPPECQKRFKLSYYLAPGPAPGPLLERMRARLDDRGIRAALVWSIDEVAGRGLLDLLPAGATKYHAIEFLVRRGRFSADRTLFAGDSGNDLSVLVSPLRAVVVANALPQVKAEAMREAMARGMADRIYVARGGLLGMNGNYAAGVLEGAVHYFPEVEGWLRE